MVRTTKYAQQQAVSLGGRRGSWLRQAWQQRQHGWDRRREAAVPGFQARPTSSSLMSRGGLDRGRGPATLEAQASNSITTLNMNLSSIHVSLHFGKFAHS